MRKIVVPVSFGENALNAARYAADLAMAIEGELHLVYVIPSPATLSPQPMPDFVFREMRDSGYVMLKDLTTELSDRTKGAVPVHTDLQTGDIHLRLVDACRRSAPFLVVMGAGEHPGEDTFGSGHTARMMQRLPYPLLVVPANATFHGIHNIVVACDREDIFSGEPPMLSLLNELNTLLGAEIEVIHVVTNGESIENALHEYKVWKKKMAALGPLLHVMRRPTVAQGIGDFLKEHPADWLLVLPKKHSVLEFHKSAAKDILPHCPVPLMSLHER